MAKYIFCMLLGAILTLGFTHFPDKKWQGFQSRTGTENIQSCTKANSRSKTEVGQCNNETYSIGNKGYTYDIGDGIPANSSISRNLSPATQLRFNDSGCATHMLSILCSHFSELKWKNSAIDTNLLKHPSRYFIYTLKRILI